MTTTYVLGAGASRHAGYPLASEMGSGLKEVMLGSTDGHGQPYAEYLIDHFEWPPNIEDLITEIQSRIDSLKNATSSQERTEYFKLGNRLGYLSTAVREWFREIHVRAANSYALFADSIINAGDVIINFNYDDSLERELRRTGKWDISQGYGFPLGATSQPSDVILLKLHGSINWLVSVFGGAKPGSTFAISGNSSLGDRPVIHRADLEYLGYKEFSGYTYESGGAFPCLILPGRSKRFFYDTSLGREFAEFWTHLWAQAAKAVKRSDRIVVCGYSLQPVDQRACELLLREPEKETPVLVVCGEQSDRIACDFRAAEFQNVEVFKGGFFEHWCSANAHD